MKPFLSSGSDPIPHAFIRVPYFAHQNIHIIRGVRTVNERMGSLVDLEELTSSEEQPTIV